MVPNTDEDQLLKFRHQHKSWSLISVGHENLTQFLTQKIKPNLNFGRRSPLSFKYFLLKIMLKILVLKNVGIKKFSAKKFKNISVKKFKKIV